jgi:hypothetical protein
MDEVVENRGEEKSHRFEMSFLSGEKLVEIGILRNEPAVGSFLRRALCRVS